MEVVSELKRILGDTLSLGSRASAFTADTRLLGELPEFDSMAVVNVLTAIEDDFGVTIDDGDLNAEVFETVGTLSEFVSRKLAE